jgi:hypothetical protein
MQCIFGCSDPAATHFATKGRQRLGYPTPGWHIFQVGFSDDTLVYFGVSNSPCFSKMLKRGP